MGMKLTGLRRSGTKVADLWPIKAMSLQGLSISSTLVNDLKPVLGMPLRTISMTDCKQITDVSSLAKIQTLERVVLPPGAKNIQSLRKLPKLTWIGYKYTANQAADEFWADYDRNQNAATTQPLSDNQHIP